MLVGFVLEGIEDDDEELGEEDDERAPEDDDEAFEVLAAVVDALVDGTEAVPGKQTGPCPPSP